MSAPKTLTQELLERIHAGQEDAVHSLVAREFTWVQARVRKRLGARLRRKAETDDFVQEAMLHALRYGPKIVVSDRGQLRALLSRIVENVLRDQSDHFRAQRRALDRERALRNDSILHLDAPVEQVGRPSQVAMANERQAWVQLGLELLDPEDREVILLRDYDDLGFDEVGEKLGVKGDAARMRYNRALPKLAKKVESLRGGKLAGELEDLL